VLIFLQKHCEQYFIQLQYFIYSKN